MTEDEAIAFVSKFYRVSAEDAVEWYRDEIAAALRLSAKIDLTEFLDDTPE